jgi:multidrug efflux pump subunit AcrA (membrane-fusion protein)
MLNLKQLSTTKKMLIGAVVVGIAAVGILQYQWGTKVSYYEVGTQSMEQLVHVHAQTYPKESKWYFAKSGGVVTKLSLEKDISVLKDDALMSIQPFDFVKKQTEVEANIGVITLLAERTLDAKDQEAYKEKLEKYKEKNEALKQAWIAHTSVLELFNTQMITSNAYKESLVQINDQLSKYMSEVNELQAVLEVAKTEDIQFVEARQKLTSSWEPVKALSLLMFPKAGNGKDEMVVVSGKLEEYKVLVEGIVTRKTADQGMYIPANAPIIEVANPKLARLQMEVPVEKLGNVKIGTEIRTKDSNGSTIKGKMTGIDKVITDQMQSDGNIIKLVKANADLEPSESFKFYNTVTASIVANYAENAVVVPKDLVYEEKGKYSVWVNNNGVLTEKPVEISFEVDELCVIKSGVKKGDKLVMDTKLHLGQKIKF